MKNKPLKVTALNQFTWIPIYQELARELSRWENRQTELITILEELRADGYVITPLQDKDLEGGRFLLREIDPLRLAHGHMSPLDVLDFDWFRPCGDGAVAHGQPVGRVVEKLISAPLRFQQHREGRIARDLDALDRVHLNRNGEGHESSLQCGAGYRAETAE